MVQIKANDLQNGVNVPYGCKRVPDDAWLIAKKIAGWK